jgi:hypothetical protein
MQYYELHINAVRGRQKNVYSDQQGMVTLVPTREGLSDYCKL